MTNDSPEAQKNEISSRDSSWVARVGGKKSHKHVLREKNVMRAVIYMFWSEITYNKLTNDTVAKGPETALDYEQKGGL